MRELEAAFTAAPAPSAPEIGVDTVPVSDRGDHLPAPEPAPAAAGARRRHPPPSTRVADARGLGAARQSEARLVAPRLEP